MRRFAAVWRVLALLAIFGSAGARAGEREIRLPATAFEELAACESGQLADFLKVLKRLEGDYRVVGILQTSRSWIVISKARRTEEFLLTSGEPAASRAAGGEPAGERYRKLRGIERSKDHLMAISLSAEGTCQVNVGSVFRATESRIAIEVHEGGAVSTLELAVSEGKEAEEKKGRPAAAEGAGR